MELTNCYLGSMICLKIKVKIKLVLDGLIFHLKKFSNKKHSACKTALTNKSVQKIRLTCLKNN